MDDLRATLHRVADLIADYRETLPDQHVAPAAGRTSIREALPPTLPVGPATLDAVVDELVGCAKPGLMASAGPRYFGFVIGGSSDAALAAELLTVGWDQCAYNEALSPAALAFEGVAGAWLKDLLGLPASASVGFTTGGQGANTVGLAAGRWKVLERVGWDVGRDGLAGAPRVRVVASVERHATIDRSLRLPWTIGCRRPDRAHVLARPRCSGAPRSSRRHRGRQRGRAQPGAREGRGRRAHEQRGAVRPGRRCLLARRDDLAR